MKPHIWWHDPTIDWPNCLFPWNPGGSNTLHCNILQCLYIYMYIYGSICNIYSYVKCLVNSYLSWSNFLSVHPCLSTCGSQDRQPFRSPPASAAPAAPAALPAASPGAFSPDCEVQGARAIRHPPGGRRCLSWLSWAGRWWRNGGFNGLV